MMTLRHCVCLMLLVAVQHAAAQGNVPDNESDPGNMPSNMCEEAFYPTMEFSECNEEGDYYEPQYCHLTKTKFCARTRRVARLCPTLKNTGDFVTVRCQEDSCVDGDDGLKKCTCKPGFSGRFCETASCEGIKCRAGLKCILNQHKSAFTCKCDFHGKRENGDSYCKEADEWGQGDPHMRTLDGLNWEFMGSDPPCQYYLAVADDFTIKVQTMYGKICTNLKAPSCTYRVIISYLGTIISLKYGGIAQIIRRHRWTNLNLPFNNRNIHCYKASGTTITCQLVNGVVVSYGGIGYGRQDVKIPELYHGRVKGLVGNFDGKNDDQEMMMPNGKIAKCQGRRPGECQEFEDSWKVHGLCGSKKKRELTEKEEVNTVAGQDLCKLVQNPVFDSCKAEISKEGFYNDCKMDYASCPNDDKINCFCSILDNLITNCDITNHPVLDWRKKVELCNIPCPEGEVYQSCGNPCTYSCDNIKMKAEGHCDESCRPMCRCPDGFAKDSAGKCIPIAQCLLSIFRRTNLSSKTQS